MVWIRTRQGWEIAEREVTAEELGRRDFLRFLGLGGAALALHGCSSGDAVGPEGGPRLDPNPPGGVKLYPAQLNPKFAAAGRELTPEKIAAASNKFLEFSMDKAMVWRRITDFKIRPWTVEIAGLCKNPCTLDVDDLARKFPLEERVYRHRCVEGWAKTIPWTGFPLRKLIELVEPLPEAQFIQFFSFMDPEIALNQNGTELQWPYSEGLTLKEAANELALLATGVYGHGLQKQFGAPVRLVVPWKYATKSIKSIVRIELTDTTPTSSWNQRASREVSWTANVDPAIPHPNWSQEQEWLLGLWEKVPTQKYNGYGEWVAELYEAK